MFTVFGRDRRRFSGVYALGSSWIGDLEDYDASDAGQLNSSLPSIMLASDGTELARFQVEYRDPVELDQISEYVREGTVATEDERFYEHGGFDLAGIARAVYVNLTGSGKEGASTITQQLVRNTILADEMNDISFKRKVREMYLSVKLEEQYSKDEILLMYLNTINYGSGAYGIEAASQRYFSKHASELTLAEAAALIGIPQSPTYNNPIDHEDNCLARRNLVLDRMLTNGYITQKSTMPPKRGHRAQHDRDHGGWPGEVSLFQQLRARPAHGSRRRLPLLRGRDLQGRPDHPDDAGRRLSGGRRGRHQGEAGEPRSGHQRRARGHRARNRLY
ncbi:MAG: transglycosylase domain-containing protein [Eggerthella lenta]